jgi:hypothetical protein
LVFTGKLLPSAKPLGDDPSAASDDAHTSDLVRLDDEHALPEEVGAAYAQPKQPDRPPLGVPQATADDSNAGLLDYLPPSRVSVPPKPLRPRDVPFPEGVEGSVDLRVMVSLFIDEAGKVRRVRLDTPDIPAAFANSIISTFLSTEFTPGKVDAVPVRSLVRIEVAFQAGPTSR